MLATTLGIEFDSSKDWDERERQYKASGKFITTSNVTQSAQGHKDGLWTTVLASAVFILEGEQPAENQIKGLGFVDKKLFYITICFGVCSFILISCNSFNLFFRRKK